MRVGQEPGCLGAIPGSTRTAASPPSLLLCLSHRIMQTAAGLRRGRTDRVEAAGFTRVLLGQHLPRQSRGRRICLVPPTGHRAPSRLTVALQRGTYRKVLWPRRHSCSPGTRCTSEQVVPVLRLVVQECRMCHCIRGLQKLPCCPWGSRRCLRS